MRPSRSHASTVVGCLAEGRSSTSRGILSGVWAVVAYSPQCLVLAPGLLARGPAGSGREFSRGNVMSGYVVKVVPYLHPP